MRFINSRVTIALRTLLTMIAATLIDAAAVRVSAAGAKSIVPATPLVPVYKTGEKVPLLWEYRATGPRAGQEGAFVCTYAYQPFVAIWCQDLNPAVVRLIKKIDQATLQRTKPANSKQRLGSFVVLVCDSRERVNELQALAEKESIRHTMLSVGAVNEDTFAAKAWGALRKKLGEAQTTVLLSAPPSAGIKASYAYRRGELTDKEIDRILADVARLLPPTEGPNAQESKPAAPAEPPGSLVLFGGRHQDLPNDVRDTLFELAGRNKAKIVVIPTAMAGADEPETRDEILKPWLDLKPLSAVVLHTRDPKTADTSAFVKPLTEATAVWFTNGHRDRLLKAYRGTLVVNELRKLQARGGVIGGAGSGASVLGNLVIDRANEDRLTEPGLGLLPGFLIEDGRATERIAEALAANPTHPALELEPGAGVLIRGGKLRVLSNVRIAVHVAKGAGHDAYVERLIPGAERYLRQYRVAAALRGTKP